MSFHFFFILNDFVNYNGEIIMRVENEKHTYHFLGDVSRFSPSYGGVSAKEGIYEE